MGQPGKAREALLGANAPLPWSRDGGVVTVEPHVLVVEDNADARESLCAVLEIEGFAVTCAKNGRDALDRLEAGDAPSLILLDLHMPQMDGFQFRDVQVHDSRWAHIPVVVYSGHHDVAAAAETLKVPYHFAKPLDLDAVVEVAGRHCPRH
jgi:CheY-like chemotaxis protein